MKKITIKKILEKKNKQPIACLTAYSKVTAQIADKYCDIILVGDSLGMVLYGMKNTKQVKLQTMIDHKSWIAPYGRWYKNFTVGIYKWIGMPN